MKTNVLYLIIVIISALFLKVKGKSGLADGARP